MARRTLAALLAVALLPAAAGSALAAPPVGVCAPAFEPATLADMFGRYPDVLEAAGEEALTAAFDAIDMNDNGLICERSRPMHAAAWEIQLSQATVVDDPTSAH